ncbi:MAG: fec operon regulator FecR [Proteobacteria bacterium]|nr:fec operon regulator FecR [Pseudomonadota bacterium]
MALDDRILDQATAWAARMGDPSFDDWDGFTLWLEGDPAHSRAYDLVMAGAAEAAEALAGGLQAANDDVPERPTRRRFVAGALTLVLVAAAAFGLWQFRGGTYTVETAPGETRLIALSDGDEITLGGGTSVTLDRSDTRFAQLEQGQALFAIRHDAQHPFRVEVGEDELVDLGTVFDVRYSGKLTTVAVAEGAVAFNPAQQNVRIDPGHFLSSEEGSREYELGEIPGSDIGGWRTGRLSFQQATLAAVADDLSRATGMRFSVAPGASKRRVSGSLLVDPVRADPASVGALLGVKVRKSDEGWVLETR